MGARRITTIPAAPNVAGSIIKEENAKRKVAGYARVSTELDEQQGSYELQLKYYEEFIKSHDDWEFAGMYADEGISGTNTKHRKGFQQMIEDALAGKIDLILTKSVSRFARNTVDSLTTIRQLKENGTEVYFEKENIFTFDGKGELLLTIMSSIAQEESRSISENVKWSVKKRYEKGKHSLAYSTFLGYDKGKNGELIINKRQAKVVRLIYKLFLDGMNYSEIAKELERMGCKTGAGNTKWQGASVKRILMNEKYKGDALLQKKFTEDFLTHKARKNKGEVPQYYIENDHEAIIESETFDRVQVEIIMRSREDRPRGRQYPITGMIQCGECGGWFGPKIWHSTSWNSTTVFECNHKYYRKYHCSSPTVHMEEPEKVFLEGYRKLLKDKEALKNIETLKAQAQYTRDLEIRKQELLEQGVQKSSREWLELNEEMFIRRTAYRNLVTLTGVIKAAEPMDEFSEEKFRELCDRLISYKDHWVVRFKGGYEVEVRE